MAAFSAYLPDRAFSQGSTYVDEITVLDSAGNDVFLGDGQVGSGSGDFFGPGNDQYYEARFQIREKPVDIQNTALLSLSDTDAIALGNGLITITITAAQTETVVSATSARVLWAELDLTEQPSGEVTTYRWRLLVQREYARGA